MNSVDLRLHFPIKVGNLPPSWAACYVGDIAKDVTSGFACGRHSDDPKGVRHLRPMNVSRGGHIDLAEIKYVSADFDERRLARGDVLFNNTNSPELIGKTAFVSTNGVGDAFSNHMTRIRPSAGIEGKFLAYQLHFYWMVGYFLHRCVKHVNQASISSSDLARTIPTIVAPTNEQRRIVAKIEELFSELDASAESLTRARAQLKTYRQALLKAAFEGKLTADWRRVNRPAKLTVVEPVDEGDLIQLPKIPTEWRYCRFSEFISSITAGNSFACDEREPQGHEIGVAKVSAISWGEYDESESKTCKSPERVKEELFIREGDFILSRANTIELVGACVIAKRVTKRIMLSDKTLRLTLRLRNPHFILHYLRSLTGRSEIQKRSTGNQESMRNIGQERIRSIIVPLCSSPEENLIVEIVEEKISALDRLQSEIDTALAKISALRQSILKRAFSGRLVGQDPSDEPAAALLARLRAEADDTPARRKTRRKITA